MNNNLPEKIIEQIKNQGIEPRPRWHFLLKKWVLWLLAIIATLSGGVAVSVIIFVFIDYDASARIYLQESIFEDLLRTVPYIWIITLVLLISITQYAVRQTKFGYRYHTVRVAAVVVVASTILGLLLSVLEVGERVQDFLANQVPYYDQLSSSSKDDWSLPEKGLLGGTVTALSGDEDLMLTDFQGKEWLIDRGNLDSSYNSILVPGSIVKMVGTQEAATEFRAIKAFPWPK